MWEGVKLILGEVYKLLTCLLTYCFSSQCSGNLTQFEWRIKDQCVETWLFLSASFLLQCKNMLMLYPGRKIQFLSSLVRGVAAVFPFLLHGISRGSPEGLLLGVSPKVIGQNYKLIKLITNLG